MTKAGLAGQQRQFSDDPGLITRATALKVFATIAAVSFVLRIFYAWHLYEDDGLWFTAAEEIVRGKALYREIYFDKPPGLPLGYALLFSIFGAHIITVRLFTIAYSLAISAALYLFGSWLYDKRVGLLAAAMFAVFSTTYVIGHVQSLSTDLLMALPYTAGAYLLIRSRWHRAASARPHRAWLAMAGGVLAGVAFQINPKGIFALIFFAVFLLASRRWSIGRTTQPGNSTDGTEAGPPVESVAEPKLVTRSALSLFALATAGFIIGLLPFIVYIAATRSLRAYWLYVWDWGARYGGYYGWSQIAWSALTRSADYFTLNNTLLIALIFLAARTIRRREFLRATYAADAAGQAPGALYTERDALHADATLLIWFAVSYAGVMVGGRFFPHYFIQVLPSLCLIGARGLMTILESLREQSSGFRRRVISVIAIGFAFTLVRFHGRGILLAADFVRRTVSESNAAWYNRMRNREERMVAAVVRDLPDGAAAEDHLGLEGIRAGGPRTRAVDGPADYVFVWGYRPEIYYWSGLLPASRYLSTQPLTGVPADVHYFGNDYRSLLDEAATAEARVQLVRDLEETQPKYIVDEIGFFNRDLAILKYPELERVMSEYKAIGSTGRFLMYVRKELRRKYLLRHSAKQP